MSAKITGKAMRVRIFLGEYAHYHHQPLYHAIVLEARRMGLAGATVMRGFEGFGASSRIHTANLVDLSADLPIVIEIIDSEEYLRPFLAVLGNMVDSGLVTLEPVTILHYGPTHRRPPQDIG